MVGIEAILSFPHGIGAVSEVGKGVSNVEKNPTKHLCVVVENQGVVFLRNC